MKAELNLQSEEGKIFSLKSELLCNGLILGQKFLEHQEKKGNPFNLGRKGGAGPAGGRYFKFPNGVLANTPLWIGDSSTSQFTIVDIDSNFVVRLEASPNSSAYIQELLQIPLKLLPTPEFYNDLSSDGLEYNKIALMHGDRTLATTINQRCRYWRNNSQCKFCAIELSLEAHSTIESKNADQIIETIGRARRENPEFANHITLTSGTTPNIDKGMKEYLEVVPEIRSKFPEIGIHIQIEPMNDIGWYKKLHDAGTDTIGIHIEILDDAIRRQVCPGKSKITRDQYLAHWAEAVKIFGKNNVDTFILTGLKENIDKFKQGLEEIIKIGVVPLITPARVLSGVDFDVENTDSWVFRDILLFAAEKCIEYGVDPTKNLAGCIRCGGCSPIIDAYVFLQHTLS